MNHEIDTFEEQLRDALRREQPPHDFSQRVLERAARRRWFAWIPKLAPAMAAVAIVTSTVHGFRAVEHRRQEMAHRQTIEALRLSSEALELAQSIVARHLREQAERNLHQ